MNITGPGITQLYLKHMYRWFGLPKKMISDRDPRFTSHFGKALLSKLSITQNLSTAFHPQTDGLSEWKNQWIEQYHHCLITQSDPYQIENYSSPIRNATIKQSNSRRSDQRYDGTSSPGH